MFALVDADGNVETLVRGNLQQTIDVAQRLGFVVVPVDTTDYEPAERDVVDLACDLAVNPDVVTADYAWERLGWLQIHQSEVDQMSLEEAHRTLLPFFPRLLRPKTVEYPMTDGTVLALEALERGERLSGKLRRYRKPLLARDWIDGEALTELGEDFVRRLHAQDFDGEDKGIPYFSVQVADVGEYSPGWRTPEGMVENLLGQNFKTEKNFPFGDVEVLGLSLVPASIWALTDGKDVGVRRKQRRGGLAVWEQGAKFNLCVGASRECIKSCLVYSGRNLADPYNVMLKQAKTSALMMEPLAFGRILYEACLRHRGTGKRTSKPMVRLNVFSDIPWELVYPDLFALLPDLQFYDYTKVPDRTPPANYDLTFSFSGANDPRMRRELARGRKAAVVFLNTEKWADESAPTFSPARAGMPETFMGFEVVDGDISDVRPLDQDLADGPPPYVVGLKWKKPKGEMSEWVYFPATVKKVDPSKFRFAVPVERELDGRLVATIVPRAEPDLGEEDPAIEGAVAADPAELQAEGLVASNPRTRNPEPRPGSPLSADLKRKLMR